MLKSNCCNKNVSIKGTINSTKFVCTECNKVCSVHKVERKKWNRNPATQIIKDKRRKYWNQLTKKEIDFYRKNEDL